MKTLITGSSGYIGSRLARQIKKEKSEPVVGLDRQKTAPGLTDGFLHGDLLNLHSSIRKLDDVTCICHLAAAKGDWGISEKEYYRDNLEATRVLIEAGKEAGIKDWVFFSTVSTMGPSQEALGEDAAYDAINPYGASKAEAEKLFHQLAEEDSETRILIIRPSVVYGPGAPTDTNIYRLIDAIYRNRFVMVGPGKAIKSTSYIDNLLAATLFLRGRMKRGVQTYIYVDEPALSTGEIVERIYKLLGKREPFWHVPLSVATPVAYLADGAASVTGIDFPITAARIKKFNRSTNFDASAIRDLGFKQPVSNEEALRKTVEGYLQHEQ